MLHHNEKDDFWQDLPMEPTAPMQNGKDLPPCTDPTPLHGTAEPVFDPDEALRRARGLPDNGGI